ncbi:hypothetical protein NZT89_000539 [Campylobacter upsaliensis]|uniref:hypothetical protein n=1 Tax=Campylobacter TaxID=194 RepID=UPI0002EAE12D|nr:MULTISPECIES: hypothetical protein [Campylobacter]EDP6884381.1 hypothetical protein [Campylobacter upsaliensis]HEG2237071.1 hypothetical protein [Campylobacter jejuni]EDP6927060.1 hypothetical protein [Campylobacter upsaliensis]EEP3374712.1 hypothetical protein [Campylobacter upsaliensis]EGB2777982.1 hypothetical protein [Campylobacter upsaliensis]
MNFFSMKDHDIYELVRELEGGKSVWVKGEYGTEYKVNYVKEEGIYYVECEGGRHTEKFDDIYEMQEYINFNFEEDEGIEAISKILINYKG